MILRCPSCGVANESAARFCHVCGASLGRACPGCGADAAPSAVFCSQCGTRLGEAEPEARAQGDEREERRVVTVLFADLAGSTSLGEQLDPEDFRAMQKELFELVSAEVERHGGICEKFVGDAVLAVFGVPQAHEDDAERAVRAALSMQVAFESFGRRLAADHGIETGLRIGIDTGEVVAGRAAAARGELFVSGDVVNVAARLQQHASTGEVLVGARTRQASARAMAYAEAGTLELRGKREPVEAWRALDALADPQARGLAGLTAPLIGREEELRALLALALRAERERTPQLVTLLGPAGIGKSRLLAELAAQLPQATILRGRCLPYGEGIAYWPMSEMAKEQAGILDTDAPAVATDKLARHVTGVVDLSWAERVSEAAAWTIGLSLPPESQLSSSDDVTRRLHDAWTRYVAALGRRGLAVVAVEDLHWASTPLLDLLEHLASALDDTAVLLVCTSRPELVERRPAWGAAAGNTTSLSLASLSRSESARLVDELLGGAALEDTQRGSILARAEGNPFFVEEILQMLVDRGLLERRDGHWVVTGLMDAAELPDSVHGVIASRLDLLDERSRDALRSCAVIGRDFWPAAVGVPDALVASLAARGLVSEQHSSTMAGMREFRFKHSLTRDVAYASLPRVERRDLHRRVAEWIQHVAPGREAETAELAAYHLTEAIRVGDADPDVRTRAFELHLAAGGAALARGALSPGRHHIVTALELAATPGERGAAQLALGRLELLDGSPTEALDVLEVVVSEAAQSGDDRLRGSALGVVSRVCWLLGRHVDAREAAVQAVEALRALSGSPELAWALARRSQLEMLAGLPGAAASAREAITAAREAGERAAEANARINLMTALGNDGVSPDAAEARAVVSLALEAGVSEEAYRSIVNYLWAAQPFVAVDELERTMSDLRRPLAHVPPLELFGSYLELSYAMNIYLPGGRWSDADLVVREHPSHEWATSRIVWCDVAATLAFRRGELERAEPLLEELAELALPSREAQRIIPASAVLGAFAAATGRSDLLDRVLRAVFSVADTRWMPAFGVAPLCRSLARAGEMEMLANLVSLLASAAATSEPTGHHRVSIATGTGLLALHDGRTTEAAQALGNAAAIERSLGRVVPAALIELDLARALAAAGDEEGARAAQQRARAVLVPVGCVNET